MGFYQLGLSWHSLQIYGSLASHPSENAVFCKDREYASNCAARLVLCNLNSLICWAVTQRLDKKFDGLGMSRTHSNYATLEHGIDCRSICNEFVLCLVTSG